MFMILLKTFVLQQYHPFARMWRQTLFASIPNLLISNSLAFPFFWLYMVLYIGNYEKQSNAALTEVCSSKNLPRHDILTSVIFLILWSCFQAIPICNLNAFFNKFSVLNISIQDSFCNQNGLWYKILLANTFKINENLDNDTKSFIMTGTISNIQ